MVHRLIALTNNLHQPTHKTNSTNTEGVCQGEGGRVNTGKDTVDADEEGLALHSSSPVDEYRYRVGDKDDGQGGCICPCAYDRLPRTTFKKISGGNRRKIEQKIK